MKMDEKYLKGLSRAANCVTLPLMNMLTTPSHATPNQIQTCMCMPCFGAAWWLEGGRVPEEDASGLEG